MNKVICSVLILQSLFCSILSINLFAQNYPIYVGKDLTHGFDIGVNTNNGFNKWLSDSSGYMKMIYPPSQQWGAVFITVGVSKNPPRPFKNFSMYRTLSIEMKGAKGGETLEIGLKDNTDLDNGGETKIQITLTTNWQVYKFLLSRFVTADLSHLYMPIEFVFDGPQGKIVYFKNITYER